MDSLQLLRSRLNTRDLILLSIITIGLITIVCGLLLFFIPGFHDQGNLVMGAGQAAAEWTGLILLVLNGTVMKTKYWNYIIAGALLVVLSAIFKILHYPGTLGLLCAGLVLMEVTYTVRFIRFNYMSPFAWMKYIWTGSWYSATIFIVFLNWSESWMLVADGLFWITIYMFLNRTLETKSWQIDERDVGSVATKVSSS